jgi:predicted alpha/beta superfamily hydrolase
MTKLIFAILTFATLLSQGALSDVSIGKNYSFYSTYLEQERSFQIHLPDSYSKNKNTYPVLYILDGNWHFTNAVAIQKSLRAGELDNLPEMIVVGINTKNPLRRELFWSKRKDFHAFMKEELISFVDKNFRTSKERILFGWEMGAYFTTYALLAEEQLFAGGITTNAALEDSVLINSWVDENLKEQRYLYIANSTRDIYSIHEAKSLENILLEKKAEKLTWKLELFNSEVHETLAYTALYKGLRFYYEKFPTLAFTNIEEFYSLGGMTYLKQYYRERSERFGFVNEISNNTKNNLIWLTWKRNDFKNFDFFMTEFRDVLETKRYASSYWQNRLGQFYLKHNSAKKAIPFFKRGLQKYTANAAMFNGLAQCYVLEGNKDLAKENFEKAIELASKDSDKNVELYKKNLATLIN